MVRWDIWRTRPDGRAPGSSESEFERLKHEERALRIEIESFTGSVRITRDEVHERGR